VEADEHAGAVPRLRHALALDPELDDAEYALAECLGKTGDAYGQWWHLGRAYELRGDIERATNAYERARDRASEGSDDYTQAVQALRMLRETFGGSW
jgi:tetratricopeptide (TPR) repeat protein